MENWTDIHGIRSAESKTTKKATPKLPAGVGLNPLKDLD
jgi:hypothetical protein